MLLLLALGITAQSPDTFVIRREAREVQAQFERTRRQLLPVTHSGGGRCEVTVGRFCYWYDPDELPLPEEPIAILRARGDMLHRLEALYERAPGDAWILGQLVRYTVEQGDVDSALVIASCDSWWCQALMGYTLHIKGDVVLADSMFTLAMAAAPPGVRCDWNNLAPVLEADVDRYRALNCPQRDSANAILFWQATPAFARRGNDVRTEWYARKTLLRALDQAMTHHGMRNSPDYNELVLRYGASTSWARTPRDTYRTLEHEINVIGLEPKPAYPFFGRAEEGRWPPDPEKPRSRFATTLFAKSMGAIENVQFARFRRNDSVVVVAGFSARSDTLFASDAVGATLSVSPGPDAPPVSARVPAHGGHGAVAVRTVAGGIGSIEVTDSIYRAWAVQRFSLDSAPAAISDLLITIPGDSLPESLEAAMSTAWPGVKIGVGGTIGIYWETYGASVADSLVIVTLNVEPVSPGFLGRVSQSLGLKKRVPPLRLAWSRRAEGGVDFASHAVEVDLSRLTEGHYVVTVDLNDGRRAERRIQIIRFTRAT
jgi:hypothetical protein